MDASRTRSETRLPEHPPTLRLVLLVLLVLLFLLLVASHSEGF